MKMRLRYCTEGPRSVWYDITDLNLPRDVSAAKTRLVERCQEYFGAQFFRYDRVVISLMRGADSIVDIELDPLGSDAVSADGAESLPAA